MRFLSCFALLAPWPLLSEDSA